MPFFNLMVVNLDSQYASSVNAYYFPSKNNAAQGFLLCVILHL